ncbi:hypothetical protein [Pseudoalteromonas sp. H105]|uniref:hypothetical protein n=1 Tax=Pseudoalteromonas sp. H105 TaxID=1348393 RepID=UPI000732260F|nr:hypothetical protein [Pseudoalteromonas sp. H105]KTF14805.1 hypothetical protein ATS75_11895 [Pseudoalteromonas sp. H105]
MFELIYIAIGIFAVILIISTWLIARKNIFEEQVRAKSVEAIWLTIQAEQEPDIQKSLNFFNAAQKLKDEIAALTFNKPNFANYKLEDEIQSKKEEFKEKSLGELLRDYEVKYKYAQTYQKFNQGNN